MPAHDKTKLIQRTWMEKLLTGMETELMKAQKYYRLMLGAKSVYAADCLQGSFVGVDFRIEKDLTSELPEQAKEFNKTFRPI